MPTIQGTTVAPGLALGPVHVVQARPDSVPEWSIRGEEVEAEVARFLEALASAGEQIERQRKVVLAAAGERDAGILAVHRMYLQDPSAIRTVEKAIREERVNAESGVAALIRKYRQALANLEGHSVRRTAEDWSEPWRVVIDVLMQREMQLIAAAEDKVVLAAAELTPQVVTFLPRERLLAVVAEAGGRFSHGAVLVRSLGIPCVVGIPNLMARLEQGMQVLVDGDSGCVRLRPDPAAIDEFLECRRRFEERREVLAAHAQMPAVTSDGHRIMVGANVSSLLDLGTFPVEQCDGVGLLRTEFLYMERKEFPSEEEQFRMYRRVIEHLDGRPLTLRTLDVGGDKRLPYLKTPVEQNPALGWRGLRITLEWQDLLRVQLRAAMRASALGPTRVMLPMVTSFEEVRSVRDVFDRLRSQLAEQGYEVARELPLGVMIEVPSTILVLEEIVGLVDFVSVGTNDLVQYLLAVDRDNPFVSRFYDPNHPAVVRALLRIAEVCNAAGKPCSVCGEIAGDHAFALMLLGMGYDSLSAAPNFLPEIRYAVRSSTRQEARELVARLRRAKTSEEVRALLARTRDLLHARLVDQR